MATNRSNAGPLFALALLAAPLLPGCIIVSKHESPSRSSEWYSSYESGAAQNRRIGIEMGTISDATAAQAGVNPAHVTLVSGVIPGTPAEKAGIRVWDIIAAIDGREVANPASLRGAVEAKADGETLTLTIVRAGQRQQIVVGTERR